MLIQSKKYPCMYYIRYADTGGRSNEYYNKTRASFYDIMINNTYVIPKVVGKIPYESTSKRKQELLRQRAV